MSGKRFYALVLVTMTLLAAFGAWVMVDGAVAYRTRPRVEDSVSNHESLSSIDPFTGGTHG